MTPNLPNVWCVRAEFGTYTNHFIQGGFIGIGWIDSIDLSKAASRDDVYPVFKKTFPHETSNVVIGQQVGQISRFLFELQGGDFVITPDQNTEYLHFGRLTSQLPYFDPSPTDGCPYNHRRHVVWCTELLRRNEFSVPFQNTIRSSLTVFSISQREEFLEKIGTMPHGTGLRGTHIDPYDAVLEQILKLNDKEFEILVKDLLTAMGFEESKVIGKVCDGGVDVQGELNIANMAKVKLFVQAKRYRLGSKISASTVKQLRSAIPNDGQGAFITTADYQRAAADVAIANGFARIGLINGRQLVDLLIEHWDDLSEELQTKLGLKKGLVIV
ncbi:MAG: hypothetical protein HGA97_01150 [Chlorobiaceae bacterium]|nr:hypothetical protein [Chlorobiaceae bacterium]